MFIENKKIFNFFLNIFIEKAPHIGMLGKDKDRDRPRPRMVMFCILVAWAQQWQLPGGLWIIVVACSCSGAAL